MEKRTLLAVVLSVMVITGGYVVQNWFYPPAPQTAQPQQVQTVQVPVSPVVPPVVSSSVVPIAVSSAEPAPIAEERVEIKTALVRAEFTNRGGDVVSYKLLKHKDRDDYVEMVLPSANRERAFSIALGGMGAKPLDELFHVKRISETIVEFYRDFSVPTTTGASPIYRLTKRYELKQNEYLFELSVTVDGGFATTPFDFGGVAYTLVFGPQIGPKFEKLSSGYEYRNYYTYTNGKRKTEKVTEKGPTTLISRVTWVSISGKYFTFLAIPDGTQYQISLSSAPVLGLPEAAHVYMTRPVQKSSKFTDTYRFYLGPKTSADLAVYDSADKNSFKLSNMGLGSVVDSSGILGPLEFAMKWCMVIFYKIIPNYGVAIILLTLLVKLLTFPLTKKASEGTIRMQALSPKIKEIQTKFKDNPSKMNVEMAEFYKKEGYNPMAGCLPMLIQIPIFFAMYNLFNNHFDLRGAMFIPGWIPDLSIGESVWNFAPFKIPFLGWSDLRVLPFLYVGSQLLYGMVTQTPDQQGNAQMKMMLYLMPIMFFFMLYDVPSGLLLYWIMSNVLTMIQQLGINKYMAGKKKHAKAHSGPVIAPHRKKQE
ncbi:MAG: membrane protein insertase YidC [Treponemataceae bacterium]